MIKIKCVFPSNNYILRKINIKKNNTSIAKIGHNEIIELNEAETTLNFKIDYHKSKVEIPKSNNTIYLILYFNFRNYFPYNFTDIMFKNSLRTRFTSKEEFDTFDKQFYNDDISSGINLNKTKITSIGLGFLLSLSFIVLSIMNLNSDGYNKFMFLYGIAGIFTFFLILFQRKKIRKKQYKTRLFAFSFASILLLIFLNLLIEIKISLILLSLILALFTLKDNSEKQY